MDEKKVFISAGEPSGDIHGSNLMLEVLKREPSVRFYGLGRDRMDEAGLQCLHPMDNHSVMWTDTLARIPALWQVYKDCRRFLEAHRPCLVILIDYAGFNLYLAQAARRSGIPVMYYIGPQLWAHGVWRVKKLKKLVDKIVVIYPFEEDFYARAGVPVRYVGHPILDELARRPLDEDLMRTLRPDNEVIVSLLPGSREQEIIKLLPTFLKAAELIKKELPHTHFIISCAHEIQMPSVKALTERSGFSARIIVGNLSEVIQASTLCITASGTVTLEAAVHLRPMVIAYRVSPFAYFIARPHMDTPFLSLVNKLAEKELVPERLMYRDDYQWIAHKAIELILDRTKRESITQGLIRVRQRLGTPGASARAAEEALIMIKEGLH